MPVYAPKVKANIDAAIRRIKAKKDGTVVHFCIARLTGPKSPPRVIFGRRGNQATPETLKTLYAADKEVSGSAPSKWFTVRGTAVIEGDAWTIYPATKANKVMDPASMKVHLRELKAALTLNGVAGVGVDPLIAASVARAADKSALVDTTPVDDEEGLVESEEEEEEEEEAEEPENELALEIGPDVALAAVKDLVARFARIKLTEVKGLRAAAGEDDTEQLKAEKGLLTAYKDLRDIQADGEKQLRGLAQSRAVASINALKELVARCITATGWIEADLAALAKPNADIAAVGLLAEDDGVKEHSKVGQWVADAKKLLTSADRISREYSQQGSVEELGALMHSSDAADEARGEKRVAEISEVARAMSSIRSLAERDISAYKKSYSSAHGAMRTMVDALAPAIARLDDIVGEASAAALHKEGEEGNIAKRRSVRMKLTADLVKRPDVLIRLVALPGGAAQLDKMVRDVGKNATTEDEKKFVKAATEARFSCTLTGEHTTKALPRLYGVLSMVPETHTADNPKLGTINRKKAGVTKMSGDYKGSVLNLEVGKTGWNAEKRTLGQGRRAGKINAFDHVTLHELGHAVDDNISFMTGKADVTKYGAWRVETPESIATVIDAALKFDKATEVSTLSDDDRRALLAKVLAADEDGAKVYVATVDGAWDTLEKHAAIARCRVIRLDGAKGMWGKGNAGATAAAIAGRVYAQAYETSWCSYELAARGDKVSEYQFRSTGEWFAEIYTAYYMDKLDANGGVRTWFAAEVDK